MMKRFSGLRTALIIIVLCATTVASQAQILTTLHTFAGYPNDGDRPEALLQALDGNFYGSTFWGGASGYCSDPAGGCGTMFRLTPSGTLTIIYSFCPQSNCADGASPAGALVQASDGNLYGTTVAGGTSGNCSGAYAPGCGTVFKLTPSGTLSTLYSFCPESNCADGADPTGLVQATDGNFYGTTEWGGRYGFGTVFKVTSGGTLTTLYSFCSQINCADGQHPNHGLVQATDGNFYGTTLGTVFRITPSGTLTTLYTFCSQPDCADGSEPEGGLVQATDGNFYGTTYYGGVNCSPSGASCGTVFKITPQGALTTLYKFGGYPDGKYPDSGLIQATDGNFYGATQFGGVYNYGTVFKITPGGTLTTLHSFDGSDGGLPGTRLVQATDRNFYGTTGGFHTSGGARNDGTVFRLVRPRACIVCPAAE